MKPTIDDLIKQLRAYERRILYLESEIYRYKYFIINDLLKETEITLYNHDLDPQKLILEDKPSLSLKSNN